MMLRRDWEILGQFKLPLGMLIASLVYGTLGYVAIFGWPFIDALYMTVTTLTTVGFREVQPVDSVGAKLFTISVLVVGISALFAGIGGLVLATVWISNNGARAKKKQSQSQ